MRILVVEDETLIALMLTGCLEDAGHEVIGPAATMAEALALCDGVAPDLALLDINLRDGSNGVALAQALFARWGVMSIFATGQHIEARQARDVAFGCILKPYEVETLLRCVEVACEVMRGVEPDSVQAGFEPFSKGD